MGERGVALWGSFSDLASPSPGQARSCETLDGIVHLAESRQVFKEHTEKDSRKTAPWSPRLVSMSPSSLASEEPF